MGGLLDKANNAKAAELIPEAVAAEVTEGAPLMSSTESTGFDFNVMSKPGLALGAIGFILMWFLGNYTLEDLTGPIPFGVVPIAALGGSFYLVWNSLNKEKTVALAIGYLLITAVPYLSGIQLGGSVYVTDIDFDEDSNELSFKVRGGFSSVDVAIEADGVEQWSGSGQLSNDIALFSVDLTDVFVGNAEDYLGKSLVDYTIVATASTGDVTEQSISPQIMNREILNAGIKFSPVLQTVSNDNSGSTTTEAVGIIVQVVAGIFSPNDINQDGGKHSMTTGAGVKSDYMIDVKIKQGTTTLWTHPTMTVDGLNVRWANPNGGDASGLMSSWIGLSGDTEDDLGTEYLDRDSFFDSDGCYTFEVTITNSYYSDSPSRIIENSWNFDWEEDSSSAEYLTC